MVGWAHDILCTLFCSWLHDSNGQSMLIWFKRVFFFFFLSMFCDFCLNTWRHGSIRKDIFLQTNTVISYVKQDGPSPVWQNRLCSDWISYVLVSIFVYYYMFYLSHTYDRTLQSDNPCNCHCMDNMWWPCITAWHRQRAILSSSMVHNLVKL